MPKRGRRRHGNSGKGANQGQQAAVAAASSPKLDDAKITKYFPISEAQFESSPDKQTSDPINPEGNIGASTCTEVVPGLLTPDGTPTKSITAPSHSLSPSPNETLPYPQEDLAALGDESISELAGEVRKGGGEQLGSSVDLQCPARRTSPRKSIKFFAGDVESPAVQSAKGPGRHRKSGNMTESPSPNQTEAGPKKSQRGRRGRKAGGKTGTSKASSTQRSEDETRVKTIKDFFPVRRSDRRCKSELEAEKKEALEDAIMSDREDGLKVEEIIGKGRGVISTKPFKRGDFVVEYYGDLISMAEAREREVEYQADPETGCYMYYFEHKNRSYCVDATKESGRLGRLLNHSRNGNCCTKLVDIKERPHLILVAKQDICAGEELLYDYGDRNKESILSHPWLAL